MKHSGPRKERQMRDGTRAPWNVGSMECGLHGMWAPWNMGIYGMWGSKDWEPLRTWDPWNVGLHVTWTPWNMGFHGTWAPWNMGSMECGLHGMWAPWNVWAESILSCLVCSCPCGRWPT
uniref:Uncharacterized protein n=1 Tax=Equus asinus TaxID=9793 RepID=A0A9L0K2G5_EQUAS